MEKQEVTAVTILDLLAAFDMVDHDLLLEVLNRRFGVKGRALNGMNSILNQENLKYQ